MTSREIRNSVGSPIGRIERCGDSAWNAFHINRGVVGIYYEEGDYTIDYMHGAKLYCKGDGLESLIRTAEMEYNKR